RIHSDVHIGNIRIGTDRKAYWIDRGYYLKMTKDETDIVSPLLKGEFSPEIGIRAVNYLLSLPENQGKAGLDQASIFGDLIGVVNTANSQGKKHLEVANDVLLTLKRRNVHVPI